MTALALIRTAAHCPGEIRDPTDEDFRSLLAKLAKDCFHLLAVRVIFPHELQGRSSLWSRWAT
eukprot:5593324-Amphidinium_carterae.1